MLSLKCLCFCAYLYDLENFNYTKELFRYFSPSAMFWVQQLYVWFLWLLCMTLPLLSSSDVSCMCATCVFLTEYFRSAFCCGICVRVCACACEANGGLLSGQRWIWGSLGPWSVQAFTLTPSMWARACVL